MFVEKFFDCVPIKLRVERAALLKFLKSDNLKNVKFKIVRFGNVPKYRVVW